MVKRHGEPDPKASSSVQGDSYPHRVGNHDERGKQSTDATDAEASDRYSGHTSTKSLVGSVLDDPIEHGRRYHGLGRDGYFLPNDEQEQTRLNILHQMYLLLLDGELTLAPLPAAPERILDIGTGTGEWAIGMAELYPFADVTGTDISAIQPDAVPSNVFFEVDDAEGEWTFSATYDLIHIRNLAGAFKDWPAIYRECYRHLKPGGYLEVIDTEHIQMAASSPNSYITIFVSALREAADKAGRPWGTEHLKRSMFEAAGFRDIVSVTKKVPVGPWPTDPIRKTIGKMWLIGLMEAAEGGSLRLLTRELDWKAEDVLDLCEKTKAALKERTMRMETPMKFVVARKPLSDTTGATTPTTMED
ncbi:MAG: hypothetical protein M1838_004804 [Thelocarpon superellum]|nr:MAG: hypothetical protein M1838_004804 [Thelocarpon superellum]